MCGKYTRAVYKNLSRSNQASIQSSVFPSIKPSKISIKWKTVIVLILMAFSSTIWLALLLTQNSKPNGKQCIKSLTKASGPRVFNHGTFCSGDLIFEDNFDSFDPGKWQAEITLGGGGNNEFQEYTNDPNNLYSKDGILHIKPTLMSDKYTEYFLTKGKIELGAKCTGGEFHGCTRTGTKDDILNPVRSARIRTFYSFSFKYGRVEFRAKMPAGDWLWPAIYMLPTLNAYGAWPRSGGVNIVESRGNREYILNGVNVGAEQIRTVLLYGPSYIATGWQHAIFAMNATPPGTFINEFHRYQFEWTPDNYTWKVDDVELGTIKVEEGGFWARGEFGRTHPANDNPWRNGDRDAPFDQQFHFVINLAIGGTIYFDDKATNPDKKPWSNISPHAATMFWDGRESWLKTWNYHDPENDDSHLQIDYVRVWAL